MGIDKSYVKGRMGCGYMTRHDSRWVSTDEDLQDENITRDIGTRNIDQHRSVKWESC